MLNKFTKFISNTRSSRQKLAVFALGLLIILIPVFVLINKKSQQVEAVWSPSHNQWAKRQRLIITNNSGENLSEGTTVGVAIDTKDLSDAGKLQSSCNDIRVVYHQDANTAKEIPHHLILPNNSTCYSSSATMINFSLQQNLNSNDTSYSYYLYFSNPEASAPSLLASDAYNTSSVNALLICPFRGTSNCVNASGSTTPATQTGALRYPGLKSGLNFDGVNDYASANDSSSLSITNDLTVELWVKVKKTGAEQTLIGKWDETTANDDRSYRLYITSGNKFAFSISNSGTAGTVATITGDTTISKDTWYHVAGVYSAGGQTLNLYVNGTTDATEVGSAGSSIDNNASLLYFGAKENTSGNLDTFFLGLLDEIRISNVIRYSSNFEVSLSPSRLDFYTNALYHLDETGKDPRIADDFFDETTNNNDGTISGAVFVSGFIGIDGPSEFGEHTGTSDSTELVSDTASWSRNEWVGYILFNSTDASHGIVTSNTANSITATLSGGTENDWDNGDLYTLSPDLGQVHSQSFASHEGVFIEEASTNKIDNPSFENTTYDTSWTEGTGSGVIIASTRTVADTNGGTQDITNSNLGGNTPKAVYVIANYATTDGTAKAHMGGSVGAATGTSNEWVVAFKGEDALVSSYDSDAVFSSAALIHINNPVSGNINEASSLAYAEFSSFITNGVRINWTTTPTDEFFITVVFFAGSELSAHANSVNLGDTTNNAVDVTDPGFQPDLVLTGLTNAVASPAANASLGSVYYNGSTYAQNGFCVRGGGTIPYPTGMYVTTSGAVCEILGNFSSVDWYGEFGSFDANGFTVTTRTRGANNQNLGYLALDLGSVPAWVGNHTTPTSTGNSSETGPDFAPQFALQLQTFAESLDTVHTDNRGGTFGLSVTDANAQFSNSWAGEDNVSTTNMQSLSDDKSINISDHDGTAGVEGSATLDANGWTTNYTAVEASGKIFPSFAVASLNFLTNTIETSSPYVKFGSRSTKITASGGDTSLINQVNPGNTNTHTMSLYAYNGTSGSVGSTIDNSIARILWEGSPQASTVYENVGGGWWRLSYTASTTNSDNSYGVWIADGETLYVDGFVLEEKSYATTFTDGSLGSGYTWTGDVNESSSNRAIASLEFTTPNDNLLPSSGSLSMWVKPNWDGDDGVEHNFFDLETLSGALRIYKSTSNVLTITDGTNSATVSVSGWNKNEWHHIVATWSSGTYLDLYVDAVAGTGSGAFSAPMIEGSGAKFHIGKKTDGTLAANSEISDFRVFDNALSSTEVTDIYYSDLVSVQISPEVDRFSNSKGQNPIALYHFDDLYGTTAHDSSQYSNNLTISGASWEKSPSENNVLRASYLKFDGTNDYLYRTVDNDFNFGSESFTVSGWFKHPTVASGTDVIVSRYGTAGFKVYMDSNGYICFSIDDDSSYGPDDSVCTTSSLGSLADINWHFFSAVKSETSSIKMYIDGIEANTLNSLTANGTLNTNSTLYVGVDSNGSSNYWEGFLDEIVFYPYAKTADQINGDFINTQSAFLIGTSNTGELSNGLIGYWNFDEEGWDNDCNTETVLDKSGSNNHGLSCPNSTGPLGNSLGKFGNGAVFDGSDDRVELPTTEDFYIHPDRSYTWSSWVNANNVEMWHPIWGFSDDISDYLEIYPVQTVEESGIPGGSITNGVTVWYRSNYTNSLVTKSENFVTFADDYYLVTVTYDHEKEIADRFKIYVNGKDVTSASSATGSLGTIESTHNRIGSVGAWSEYFNGYIDDARFYNKALTPEEVMALYKWSPDPITHLTFDEGDGNTTYDKSGNGNDASLNGGMTNDSWVTGKFGTALNFNGITNYVNVPASSSFVYGAGYTFSLWIKPDVVNIQQSPISQNYDANKIVNFWINDSTLRWETDGGANFNANKSIEAGTWQYITGTYDAESGIASIYINGVLDETSSVSSDTDYTDTPIFIGRYNADDYYFDGAIDDVKIYNYPRTSEQIVRDMNTGHPAPGSPIGSATAHWAFDEGYGTTANDQSINNLDLTLSNTSWIDSGKFGKAWNGTGSNWLTRTDNSALDFGTNEDFTLSMWFKSDSSGNPAGVAVLMDKHTETDNPGYRLSFLPMSGQVACEIDDDSSTFPDDTAVTANDYYDGLWHHAVCVRNTAENDLYLYIDGKLDASGGSLSATGDLSNSADLIIGDSNGSDDGDEFAGDIDEVKIFRSALDSEQIKILYNNSSGLNLGGLSTDSSGTPSWSASRQHCVPGDTSTCNSPISEWLFNEGTGTGSSAVKDTSSNSLDGHMDSSMTENNWIRGASGTAMNFGGNPQRITLDDYNLLAGAGTFSFEIWVKPDFLSNDAANRHVFDLGPFALRFNASRDDFTCSMVNNVPTSFDADTTSVNWDRNSWHQIYCVYDGSTWKAYWDGKIESSTAASGVFQGASATDRYIGYSATSGTYFNGGIDTFRIYDYARTPKQINRDYNQGKPVYDYGFDECSGTTANNSGLNSNGTAKGVNLTITPQSLGNTSAGSCSSGVSTEMWNNGASGKFSYSLDFDGSDDYATTSNTVLITENSADTYTNVSWGGWFYPSTASASDTLIHKNNEFRLTTDASGYPQCEIYSSSWQTAASGTSSLTSSSWNHVLCTYDGTDIKLYMNGNLADTQAETDSITSSSSTALNIARDSAGSGYFDGKIDNVRIWQFDLNSVQVKLDYNDGAVNYKN